MKNILYILAVILLAVSCMGLNEADPVKPDESIRTFYGVVESAESKASLGGSSDDAFRSVLWDNGDRIAVIDNASWESAEFVNRADSGSETAVFEGSIGDGDAYWAFYPFSAYVSAGRDGVTFNFPSVQNYVEDNVEEAALPMVAELEDDGMFHFHNLCGILELNLTGKGNVRRITFKGYDAEGKLIKTSGEATVDATGENYELKMGDNASASVVLECGAEGVALSETVPVPFHIALPAGTYESFNVVVAMADGAKMKIESSKPLGLIRSERTKTSPKAFVENYYIDLSEEGTANCYIVSEADTYTFRMTKGNSSEVVTPVFSVSVLWESFDTDEIPHVGDLIKSVTFKDDRMIFRTADSFHEGNAVIAAHNAAGTIVWSWHIWMTDRPQEIQCLRNGSVIMDRNLGATESKPGDDHYRTFGLLYQWGRKDPFLNFRSTPPGYGEMYSTGNWTSTGAGHGIENSIKSPMAFFIVSQYLDTYEDCDWAHTYRSGDYFRPYPDNTRWQETKTIYDPCPSGWKVPTGGTEGFWVHAGFPNGEGVHPVADGGMTFGAPYCEPEVYFPIADTRQYDGTMNTNDQSSYYWTVTPASVREGKPACTLRLTPYADVYTSYDDYTIRGNGYSVRCVKE